MKTPTVLRTGLSFLRRQRKAEHLHANPYQASGTFDDLSYVERDADKKLLREILGNQRYPYLLAPHQSGKSSLLAHTIHKLDATKFDPVFIDFSTYSPDCLESYAAFLDVFITEIVLALELPGKTTYNRNPSRILKSTLKHAIQNRSKRIIVFIDEIDHLIDRAFKDDFFGLIRSFFNQRTTDAEVDFRQIQFVLSGAAQSTQLISNENVSPFNVGVSIHLDELSLEYVIEMTQCLRKGKWRVTYGVESEIYKYTNGSVYLTQLILERLWTVSEQQSAMEINTGAVNKAIEGIVMESSKNAHFQNIYTKIISKPELLKAFQRKIAGRALHRQILDYLEMTGITSDTSLYRNLIYEHVFDPCGPLSLFKTDRVKEECGEILDMRIGRHWGLEILYKRYAHELKKRLMARYDVAEPLADEVCNTVFFRFYQKIKQFRGEYSVYIWLCTLAHNELINRLREMARRPEDPLLLSEEQEANPHDMEKELCYERCVRQATKQAENGPHAECLQALTLSSRGLSIEEIVKVMGRTAGAMRYFLTECRKKLRQHPAFKRCWKDCEE